ncbi:hypothetical protein D3C74_358250 [compost metagenome]
MFGHIFKFERMVDKRIRAIGQAIDLSVIFAVNHDNLGRNMTYGSVCLNNNSCGNFTGINTIRNHNISFDIGIKLRYFDSLISVDALHRKV